MYLKRSKIIVYISIINKVNKSILRLPMVEEAYALDGGGGGAGAAGGGAGAWHTLQHAEQQQAALASALLGKCLTTYARIRFYQKYSSEK